MLETEISAMVIKYCFDNIFLKISRITYLAYKIDIFVKFKSSKCRSFLQAKLQIYPILERKWQDNVLSAT